MLRLLLDVVCPRLYLVCLYGSQIRKQILLRTDRMWDRAARILNVVSILSNDFH